VGQTTREVFVHTCCGHEKQKSTLQREVSTLKDKATELLTTMRNAAREYMVLMGCNDEHSKGCELCGQIGEAYAYHDVIVQIACMNITEEECAEAARKLDEEEA
jgi:hypothetical protein